MAISDEMREQLEMVIPMETKLKQCTKNKMTLTMKLVTMMNLLHNC